MGMGMCKPNCCVKKMNTFTLKIESNGNDPEENIMPLGRGKTFVMRTATRESNFTSVEDNLIDNSNIITNFPCLIISSLTKLTDESVYKNIIDGYKLDATVCSLIIDLNEKSLFALLKTLYEKLCSFENYSELPLVKKMSESLKFSLKKLFDDLDSIICNTLKPMNEVDKQLKDTLIIFVELYHFSIHQVNSKQKLSLDFKKTNSMYSKNNYWKNIKDIETYLKHKILSCVDLMGKVRHFFKPKGVKYDVTNTQEKISEVEKFLNNMFNNV